MRKKKTFVVDGVLYEFKTKKIPNYMIPRWWEVRRRYRWWQLKRDSRRIHGS